MRSETRDDVREKDVPAVREAQPPAARPGATVVIPARPQAPTPFTATTLHARLALLRPQPVTLRPVSRSDT